jgi:DNA-binding MarR family transcriptional regulator
MRISGKRIYIFGEDVTRIVKRLEAEGKIARIRIPALSPFGPHIKRTRLVDVNNNPYA